MNIGLIAEGASELRILKHLLGRYLGSEHNLNEIQPQTNVQGKQETEGGWHRVIQTFEKENSIKDALIENDYIVIQIDTDHAETVPYSVSKIGTNGQYCGHEELWVRVQNRILDKIPDISIENKSRILLVICINEIECWLLPLVYNNPNKCKTTNCVVLLNKQLSKKNLPAITGKNDSNAVRSYNTLLRDIKKAKDIEECAQHNYGFEQFIGQLKEIKRISSLAKQAIIEEHK